MKYLAINIGPIVKTFSMARKPKEFWAASFMFSYLMQCILERFDREKDKVELISPHYEIQRIGVGLFPDRAFYLMKKEVDVNKLTDEALDTFIGQINGQESNPAARIRKSFFNLMTACQEYESSAEAITGLNRLLDIMELSQKAWSTEDFGCALKYIQKANTNSPLFKMAFEQDFLRTSTLEEIARAGVQDTAYTYQRYVCIVQADGDNMGKIVSSEQLEGKLNMFSSSLMSFGKEACQKIKTFGGLPIYAGGDDLLFIAPVCSAGKRNILELIDEIDQAYREVQKEIDETYRLKSVHTSMSYGISIIYCKYPLYEAWENARDMLFGKAKLVDGKNAIAISLRKNSGSGFLTVMQKSAEAYSRLIALIECTPKETLVSAVAHKIRANKELLGVLPKEEPFGELHERLSAFYKETIDTEAKSPAEINYLKQTQEIFEMVYTYYFLEKKKKEYAAKGKDTPPKETTIDEDMDTIISEFYSILRIAKFIKGEEVKDE